MDHFIVLAEGIHEGKRGTVTVIFLVHRVLLRVGERVMHPAHILLAHEARTIAKP